MMVSGNARRLSRPVPPTRLLTYYCTGGVIPGLAAEQLYELSQLAGVTMPREVLDLVRRSGRVRLPAARR